MTSINPQSSENQGFLMISGEIGVNLFGLFWLGFQSLIYVTQIYSVLFKQQQNDFPLASAFKWAFHPGFQTLIATVNVYLNKIKSFFEIVINSGFIMQKPFFLILRT